MLPQVHWPPGDGLTALFFVGPGWLETTTAHATPRAYTTTTLHYPHAAAYVTVPPLRLTPNTSTYLMSLLAK